MRLGKASSFSHSKDRKLSQAGGEQPSIREGNKTRTLPYRDLIEVAEFV
jgi:hypothetical protein